MCNFYNEVSNWLPQYIYKDICIDKSIVFFFRGETLNETVGVVLIRLRNGYKKKAKKKTIVSGKKPAVSRPLLRILA